MKEEMVRVEPLVLNFLQQLIMFNILWSCRVSLACVLSAMGVVISVPQMRIWG